MNIKEILDIIPSIAVLVALILSVIFFGIPGIKRKRSLQ